VLLNQWEQHRHASSKKHLPCLVDINRGLAVVKSMDIYSKHSSCFYAAGFTTVAAISLYFASDLC